MACVARVARVAGARSAERNVARPPHPPLNVLRNHRTKIPRSQRKPRCAVLQIASKHACVVIRVGSATCLPPRTTLLLTRAICVGVGIREDCQLILRGGSDGPNYREQFVREARDALEKSKVPSSVMIDCSHANSAKDPARQPIVLEEVLTQVEQGADCIHAVMIESHLKAGSQSFPRDLDELEYGVSITDGCIDWDTTEACLRRAAEVVDKSRFS